MLDRYVTALGGAIAECRRGRGQNAVQHRPDARVDVRESGVFIRGDHDRTGRSRQAASSFHVVSSSPARASERGRGSQSAHWWCGQVGSLNWEVCSSDGGCRLAAGAGNIRRERPPRGVRGAHAGADRRPHRVRQPASSSRFPTCHNGSPILIGAHHKADARCCSSTSSSRRCARRSDGSAASITSRPHAPRPSRLAPAGLQLCFLQHGVRFKLQNTQLPYRFIPPRSVTRSRWCCRATSMHLKTTERWANRPERRYNGTTYRKYLNSLYSLKACARRSSIRCATRSGTCRAC